MASLTHVCMLTKNGWENITAEKASEKFHGSVSARRHIFMCDLCGQPVILANGKKQKPHFRHSRGESDKNCSERKHGQYYNYEYQPQDYQLPLRIVNITKEDFSLQMGFVSATEQVLDEAKNKKIIITATTTTNQTEIEYCYSFERLNPDGITYLNIGDVPCSDYKITTDEKLQSIWPKKVQGFNSAGSLFDPKSGKFLPKDADVSINKTYYLLTTKNFIQTIKNLKMKCVCIKKINLTSWHIYEITAEEMSDTLANFFLSLNYRLTKIPVRIQPVWPIYKQTPYLLQHNREYLAVHFLGCGGAKLKTYPPTYFTMHTCAQNTGIVYRIPCKLRQQLIAVGRTRVLKYMFFEKKSLLQQMEDPTVKVVDRKSELWRQGLHYELPAGNTLRIQTEYDGLLKVKKGNSLLNRIPLEAEKEIEIPVQFGMKICILQGKDCVYETTFTNSQKNQDIADDVLLRKLTAYHGKKVRIEHLDGALAVYLNECPKTKLWLRKQIEQGWISEDAYRLLKSSILQKLYHHGGEKR